MLLRTSCRRRVGRVSSASCAGAGAPIRRSTRVTLMPIEVFMESGYLSVTGVHASLEVELERADHADLFHRRAGGAEGTGLVAAVEAKDLDHPLVRRADAAYLRARVCGELLRDGARVLGRLGEELRSEIVELRDHVARVRAASFAAVECDSDLEELLGRPQRDLHEIDFVRLHDQGRRHHVAEAVGTLRLVEVPRALVDDPGGLAPDLLVLEPLLAQEGHRRVPVRADARLGVAEILTRPA